MTPPPIKVATFGYNTPNLGDDLQAMSAAAQLPRVDALFNRDSLSDAPINEPHLCLMASWFLVRNYRRVPHPNLVPIFFGFCLGRDELLDYGWRQYLKQHEPIGCRDMRTVEKLTAAGIEAYHTGCITLFLGRRFKPVPVEKRSGIVFVDIPDAAMGTIIPDELCRRAQRITNLSVPGELKNPLARMTQIARNCDLLRHAELVVTSRLHTTLPCIGFQTPVIPVLEEDPKTRGRFSGYEQCLNLIYHTGGKTASTADWNSRSPAVLPDHMEQGFARLQEQIRAHLGCVNEHQADSVFQRYRLPEGCEFDKLTVETGFRDGTLTVTETDGARCVEGFEMMQRFEMPCFTKRHLFSRGRPRGNLASLLRPAAL
jgi:Polysaccharide pyruvyl transferase